MNMSWFKDDEPLGQGEILEESDRRVSSRIRVKNAEPEMDSGSYECVASNQMGQESSVKAFIQVQAGESLTHLGQSEKRQK